MDGPAPWRAGPVERLNRTLKAATVRRCHDETHRQLEGHLAAFLDGYNVTRRLKTLRGLTPYDAICTAWANAPRRFRLDPVHLTLGLNTIAPRDPDWLKPVLASVKMLSPREVALRACALLEDDGLSGDFVTIDDAAPASA